uniref:Uncharacterized protein n=1 Tax=Oryza glumipatula TaxID=40148 RepID=A0A0E0B8N1_9ORYZ
MRALGAVSGGVGGQHGARQGVAPGGEACARRAGAAASVALGVDQRRAVACAESGGGLCGCEFFM